ncbi:MAG: tRNA pseudouridine(38-40) synthase TruA [Alphaproteobacteria bacterium]|nr:tRNA pseudouridine(38-40) synthase TruA [Alphaproteobacteria bacterium]
MARYRLTIEYDGGPFVGWQRQDNGPSVQAALEAALAKFTRETPETIAAGRTDAGVHALGQVVHFDLARDWEPAKLRDALNYHLRPDPVVVVDAAAVPEAFHARLSAVRRSYLFRILNRTAPPALEVGRVWHVDRRLDVEAMHAAAQLLVGHHDFTSFRATTCQARSPLKTLDRLDVRRVGDEVHVDAVARSFLHHQVRNMVGTLKLVGDGKWSPAEVGGALASRDRRAAGPTAPPDGLYLVAVDY